MKKIISILMERDGLDREEAKKLIQETYEEIIENPNDANTIIMNNLGLEPDYLIDLLYVVIMALTVFCVSLLFAVINRLCGHFFKRLRAAL